MTLTVGQRIEAQGPGLVGRESERAFLHELLGDGGPLGRLHPRHRRGRQVDPRSRRSPPRPAPTALSSSASTPARSSRRARGFLDAISTATGGDLGDRRGRGRSASRASARGSCSSLDRYEVLRPLDLWLQQTFVPVLDDSVRVVLAGREGPMAGWSTDDGPPVPEPAAGQPAARRRRGAPPPGWRRRRRPRADQPPRPRPPAVAAPRRVGARRRPRPRPRGDDGHGHRRGAHRALSRPPRPADPPGPRRRLGRPAADALPDGRDAARRRAPGCLRAAPRPAVRRAEQRRPRHPRHRPRGRRRLLRATDPDRSRRYRIAAWRQLRDEVTRRRPTRCGATPRTSSTSSRTRPSARRSSRPPSTATSSIRPGRRLAGDPRDRDGVPSRPSPWRSSRTGGAACRTRSGRPATAPGTVVGFSVADPDRPCPARAVRRRPAGADLARPRPALPVPAVSGSWCIRFQFAPPG